MLLPFSAKHLQVVLDSLPECTGYFTAFSGGLDSCVLLHALCSLDERYRAKLHVIHVNHGLHPDARSWAGHCAGICTGLGVEFSLLEIRDECPPGESLESWARNRRYQLMAAEIKKDAMLLTAHHQDDQAETLLLQMLRGAGVDGLAAMPLCRKRGHFWHARPLLAFSRSQLQEYATGHRLEWVEDESNYCTTRERNFIRHAVIPVLRQRWSGMDRTLARVAAHQAEAKMLLEEQAAADLRNCSDSFPGRLKIEQLSAWSTPRQANVIRYWLRRQGLPVPNTARMQQILEHLLPARNDAAPRVSWPGCDIRRYRTYLYACTPRPRQDAELTINWDLDAPCNLAGGTLTAELKKGPGIDSRLCPRRQLQVRFRKGGETIRLTKQGRRQELKKLFQKAGIPPWIRSQIPLLYAGDSLVAVAGLWIDVSARSDDDEIGWQVHWQALNAIDITDPAGQ